MRHFLPVVVLLLVQFSTFAQSDFRSRQSGDWSDSDTWEEFNGTSWQNSSNVPDAASGIITVESFMTVTISTAVIANQIVIPEDAMLDIVSGGTLTLTDEAGTELDIATGVFAGNVAVRSGAVLENQGEITSSNTNFSVSGEFIHNRNGGAIPPAGWASGSKLTVRGITNTAPTGFNISLYDFEWDADSQSANVTLDGPLGNIGRHLSVTSTNDQRLILNDNNTVNATVGGDLTIGAFSELVLSNSGNTTLTVTGDVINDGILRYAIGGGNAQLNLNAGITSSGDMNGTGTLTFQSAGAQSAAITGGTFGTIHYLVPDGADLDLTTSILGGDGSLTVGNNVTLRTGLADAAGTLQNNTTGGAIRVPVANRTFGSNLELVFNGADPQFIGDGYPAQPGVTLQVDNLAGVTLTHDLTVTGDVQLNQGALILDGHHLIAEQLIASGTGFFLMPDENAILEIRGSGAFGRLPLPSGTQSLGSLILERSGGAASVELTTDLIIHGNLVLNDGTLDLDNNTLELRQDVVTVNGEIATSPSSGIRIAGSGPFSGIPFAGMNNDLGIFIYDRAGETWVTADNLTVYNEFGLYAGTVDNTADALTLNNNGRIRRIEGNLTGNAPQILTGSYHVVYEGGAKTAGLELPDAATPDVLRNLTVSGGPVTIDKNSVVNGNLSISGTLEVNGADLTMRGTSWTNTAGNYSHTGGSVFIENNVSVSNSGTQQFDRVQVINGATLFIEALTLAGDLVVDAGGVLDLQASILFNGAGDQQVQAQSAEIPELVINKSGGRVILNQPLLLTGDLRIETATELASDGHLVITADVNDPLGGGRVDVLPAGALISGDVVSEWYQADGSPSGVPMYFGSTVSDGTVAGLQDDILVTGAFTDADSGPVDPSLFRYNETVAGVIDNGWEAYPDTDNLAILEAGTGYQAVVMENGPHTLDLSGTLNAGDITIPLTYTDSGTPASDGWNLVANPFASAIGWDQLNGWDKSFVRGVIAVYENGKFRYYNGSGAGQGTQLVLDKGIIAKHQAFWVQATTAGDLVIGEQTKVDAGSVGGPVNPANQMLLTLSDGTTTDQALIVISNGATEGYDPELDAPKFDNEGMDIATTAADGTPLAFNFLDPLGCGGVIEVQISDVVSGEHTLSVNRIAAFDVPYLVTLRDQYLNVDHNANNQPDYTFTVDTADPASWQDRFTLIFAADLEDLVNQNLSYSVDNTICAGETGTVTFAASQAGVTYQLEINGEVYGNPQTGTGATIFFDLVADDLQESNTLRVLASPAECATPVYLNEDKTINKTTIDPQILFAGGRLASNYTAGNTWFFNDLSNQISTANEIDPVENGTYILQVSVGGCTATASYEYVVTSLEKDIAGLVDVYPNPVAGQEVRVALSDWDGGEVQVEVISSAGVVLETHRFSSGSFVLPANSWSRGMYILRLTSGSQVYQRRVVRK